MKCPHVVLRLALLVFPLVLGACVTPAITPSHQPDQWQRIQTQHFELATDLAPEAAKRAAISLERNRAAILAAAWGKGSDARITSPAAVVVLADRLQFYHYGERQFVGLYSSSPRPTIFLAGAPEVWEAGTAADDSTTSVLRHELVHQIAGGIYGRQPRWFAEGLAQFLETIVISEDGTTAIMGRLNLVALRKYKTQRNASVRDALGWKSDSDQDPATLHSLYGLSWLLVHWLYNTQSADFAAYQVKLAKGVDPAVAWNASFPTLLGKDLDRELQQYAKFGKFVDVPVALQAVSTEQIFKPITEADIGGILAQLAWSSSRIRGSADLKQEARKEIDRALTLEPGSTLALRLLRIEQNVPASDAVARLRQQVARRADDGEAWLLLGELLGDAEVGEQEQALRRAVALLPRSARAYNALAWMLLGTKRAEAALPLATKAALLAPWDAAVLDTYAAALFAVGRCPDALEMQKRAVDLVPESTDREGMLPYTTHVMEYDKVCGTSARAGTAPRDP